ncbi:uncharacterized protein LOC106178894 [Lingula anatina]|uniref:Uncharacterized protein LOC106178894 n=1 Tax=Lingula anatina TaxID=7574 RepID=A0A1S3K4Z9_LINAN|nr:uncharacterized protein LOC106178894 [Lingula anatina]|eukprot:XP_013417713.1 uncharacterized protein LOC106178894 [Lingula anatina]
MAGSYQRKERYEQEMRRKLEGDFSSLTVSEAYRRCLNILEKGVEEGMKRGSPNFETIRMNRMNLKELSPPVQIMDFGGGTGTPMSAICEKLHALNKDAIVSVEEPHKESLQKYKKCIEDLDNATLNVAYSGRFQDYFGKSVEELRSIGTYPEELQDRVLAIHSMYHLTRWLDDSCDPHGDIKRAVIAMYSILKPGGMLVIELDGGKNDFIWKTSLRCCEILCPEKFANFRRVGEARRSLLFQGGIVNILNEAFPMVKGLITHDEIPKGFVLSSLAEVGAYVSIIFCDGWSGDSSKFDHRMLSFCMDFIQREGSKYGLSQEEDGMWRSSNMTHFITIKKAQQM